MLNKFSNIFFILLISLLFTSCKSTTKEYSTLWDKDYLLKHDEISLLIDRYNAGIICLELQTLRTDLLTHREISEQLIANNYKCESKPLYFLPNGEDKRLLTKAGSSTSALNSKDLVYQEIWLKNHCVVRIKPNGFPGNRRSYPHANKAVIIEPDAYSYKNEAFKITNGGQAVPKGPSQDVGMFKCAHDSVDCNKKIDNIMQELHPPLVAPSPRKFCKTTDSPPL